MASTHASAETVEQALFDAIAALGPDRADVRRAATFDELDLDSLDVVELAQLAGERWGAKVEPQDLGNLATVGEALDLVLARMP